MTESVKNFTSSAAVCILYILGSLVITAPFKGANRYTFLVLIFLAVLGVLISLAALPLIRKFINLNAKNIVLRLILIGFCAAVSVYALFCTAKTFKDLFLFVKTVVLPEMAVELVFAVLFLSVYGLAQKLGKLF